MEDKILSPKYTRVKLNVGGTVFETYLSTLTKVNESVLSAMVAEEIQNGDELFIDRNPLLFAKVLDYLRDDERFVPPSDDDAREALRREAEFYYLPELVEKCLPEKFHTGVQVKWKESAIESYWKVFAMAFDRPSCALCAYSHTADPKCLFPQFSKSRDGTPKDEYCLALKYQMRFMKGKVTSGPFGSLPGCFVIWESPYDKYPLHIPTSALRLAK
ncbi:unnamed protein product [Cylicocyclus nassatus]|uniref:BTB domain-containing protein n=1 Tax=Cylicocyclus nassatus TaxID=53992 RepID=A0AA36DSB3_CYLNA|nr:unnamed protein product [Cylicocyclus nassatus]